MPQDGLLVRPARPEDPCDAAALRVGEALLHRLRGRRAARARRCWARVYAAPRARRELRICHVARPTGELVGVLAGFPVGQGDRWRAASSALTLPALPPWRWPGTFRHLAPPARVAPRPPAGRLLRRRAGRRRAGAGAGLARRLLDEAEREARRERLRAARARHRPAATAPRAALYEAYGFGRARGPPRRRRPRPRARSAGPGSSATSRRCRARARATRRLARPEPR